MTWHRNVYQLIKILNFQKFEQEKVNYVVEVDDVPSVFNENRRSYKGNVRIVYAFNEQASYVCLCLAFR